MEILITLPTDLRSTLFTPDLDARFDALGDVDRNESDEQLSVAALRERISGKDVCVTGWGSPKLTGEVLENADDLGLLAHVGGSLAPYASEALYDRGVAVCSAVREMAPYVAEGTLGMILASLRDLPRYDAALKRGEWNPKSGDDTLFGASVGLVGLGSVGMKLLDLLAPFGVEVSVYDPYIDSERLADDDFAELAGLDTVLETSEVVSVHAAKTPETIGLLDAERLACLPDGALLVNTARGAIVEQDALIRELETGRIGAALDVFEPEPLAEDSALCDLDNVLLVPHRAGSPSRRRLAAAMVEEVERFAADQPLEHRVSRERFGLMTDESLTGDDES